MGVHMPRIVLYPDESVFQSGGFCMFKTLYFSVEMIEASNEIQTCGVKFLHFFSSTPSLTG